MNKEYCGQECMRLRLKDRKVFRTVDLSNFVMMKIPLKTRKYEIQHWIDENVTGKFYLKWDTIGFEKPAEATWFKLSFNIN